MMCNREKIYPKNFLNQLLKKMPWEIQWGLLKHRMISPSTHQTLQEMNFVQKMLLSVVQRCLTVDFLEKVKPMLPLNENEQCENTNPLDLKNARCPYVKMDNNSSCALCVQVSFVNWSKWKQI